MGHDTVKRRSEDLMDEFAMNLRASGAGGSVVMSGPSFGLLMPHFTEHA